MTAPRPLAVGSVRRDLPQLIQDENRPTRVPTVLIENPRGTI